MHGSRNQAAAPQLWGRLPDLDRKRAGEKAGQTLPESGKCKTSQAQSLFRNGRLKPLQYSYSRPHSDKTFLSHIVRYRLNCVFPISYTETPTPSPLECHNLEMDLYKQVKVKRGQKHKPNSLGVPIGRKDTKKATCEPRKGASPEATPAGTLIWDPQHLEL